MKMCFINIGTVVEAVTVLFYLTIKLNIMAKYSKKAGEKVGKVMDEMKQGKLRSGSGAKVTNRKQAIAIGLSEAREEGAKVPQKSGAKKSAPKKAAAKKSAPKKSAAKGSAAKKAAPKKSAAKKTAPKKSAAKKSASKRTAAPKKSAAKKSAGRKR